MCVSLITCNLAHPRHKVRRKAQGARMNAQTRSQKQDLNSGLKRYISRKDGWKEEATYVIDAFYA